MAAGEAGLRYAEKYYIATVVSKIRLIREDNHTYSRVTHGVVGLETNVRTCGHSGGTSLSWGSLKVELIAAELRVVDIGQLRVQNMP